MPSIFRPKHQKIILQCYPSTHLPLSEALPNAAELSSLIYYASTRRTKLDKVGTFLTKKTVADVAHKRLGHINVTLHILDQLLINCSEDVGVLSPYVLSILQNVTNLMELSSHLGCLDVYITYCKTVRLDQNQAFGDAEILSRFLDLTTYFYNCNGPQNNKNSDWAIIPVRIARAVSDYIDPAISNYYATKTKSAGLISLGVTVLLHTICKSSMDLSLVKVSSGISANDKGNVDESVGEEALSTLKSFFNTSSKSQMDSSNKAIIQFALKNNLDFRWVCHLLSITTKKSHIELRYRVIGLLLLMIDGSQELDIKANVQSTQFYLANIIAYLLSIEDIQFFAVPVKDVTAKLISLESKLVKEPSTNLSDDLIDSYAEIIKNLTHRVYYNSQINDMLLQITEVYANFINENDITETNSLSYYQKFTDIVINHITDILNISKEPSIKVKMNPMSSDIFKRIYYLLDHIFDEISTKDTTQFNTKLFISTIIHNWMGLFTAFYSNYSEKKWSSMDYHLSATNTNENVICFYMDFITRVLVNAYEFNNDEICVEVVNTTHEYIKATGPNFLINWWKFARSWLANGEILYIVSLLIMKFSGYEIIVNLANNYLSKLELPNWALQFSPQGHQSNEEKLSYDELTNALKQVTELKDIMNNMTSGTINGYNGFHNGLTLPISDFERPMGNQNVLSESNSVKSWKIHEPTEGKETLIIPNGGFNMRKAMSNNDNYSSSMNSILLGQRSRVSSKSYGGILNGGPEYAATRIGSGSTLDGLGLTLPQPRLGNVGSTVSSRASFRSGVDSIKINLDELRQATLINNVDKRPVQNNKRGLAFSIDGLNLSND